MFDGDVVLVKNINHIDKCKDGNYGYVDLNFYSDYFKYKSVLNN